MYVVLSVFHRTIYYAYDCTSFPVPLHHNAYRGFVKTKLHTFISSALYEGEELASRSDPRYLLDIAAYTRYEAGGSQNRSGRVSEDKNSNFLPKDIAGHFVATLLTELSCFILSNNLKIQNVYSRLH
jgi:hypothetical protein